MCSKHCRLEYTNIDNAMDSPTRQPDPRLPRKNRLYLRVAITRLLHKATPGSASDKNYLCPSRRITGMRSGLKMLHGILGAALILMLAPGLALAYVGPGAGISMLGALWGLIVGVVMAVGVILFWPIRIMLRKAKAKKANAKAAASADDAASDSSKPADNSPAS
jgi:hypothetical protein